MIESMIFFPEKKFYEKPEDYGFQYEDVHIVTPDGCELFGWYLPARQRPFKGTLLFFHGNAGNISNRLYKIQGWLSRGFSVLLIDYRGYGKSTGTLKQQEHLDCDARASFDWLCSVKKLKAPQIVLYGESLGSYAAVFLGAQERVAGVILEAPFTSLFDVARTHYPFVIPAMLSHVKFSNAENIAKLKAPLFILHGEQDEICPYAMAGELFEKAPEPKGFLSIPGGQHNDLPMAAGEDFYEKPCEFLMHNSPSLTSSIS